MNKMFPRKTCLPAGITIDPRLRGRGYACRVRIEGGSRP